MSATRHAIGLMSGTSADGVDGVLLRDDGPGHTRVIANHVTPYPSALQARLLEIARENAAFDAAEFARLDTEVARHYCASARALLNAAGTAGVQVDVIGMHGQTIAHLPPGNSLQIGNPSAVATASGVPVVADLRRGDMALGGQGAPLVPAFHQHVFAQAQETRAVINIGGIANITWLPATGDVNGFDTGPGNTLMDAWCRRHLGTAHDEDGAWAAQGRALPELLDAWLQHPYLQRPAPKSTGLGEFCLERIFSIAAPDDGHRPEDVQATLLALTVRSIVAGIHRAASASGRTSLPERVLICGGGSRNGQLMRELTAAVSPTVLQATDVHGLPALDVEAAAFAWLALRRLDGLSGPLASVTGARANAVSGGLYLPAG